MVIDVIVMV